MSTPNAELAYAVLDHIDAHPELWDQGRWIAKAECGTVACFAGWACLLSGEHPNRAEQLLGASRLVGSVVDGDWEDEDLFHEFNSREDLGRLVAEIFGPRPASVPVADHAWRCGELVTLHVINDKGQRAACSDSNCDCRRFVAAEVARG